MDSSKFESKTHLLAILDNMPYIAWYKDDKGRFISVNQPLADSCGKSKEQIIGKTDFDIWPYELALLYTKNDLEVIRTGKKKSVEEPVDSKTGAVWYETFKSPVFDSNNNVIGTIGIAKDISERKEIEIKLENQRIFMKSMIDSIPDFIFYKDINSIYLGCNQAFANQLIGLSEEEIIGKTHFDFDKDFQNAKLVRQKDIEVFAKGKTQINEETLQLVNGNFIYVETSKTPFYNENGEIAGLIGISRDITARKNFENEMKKNSKELELKNKSLNEAYEKLEIISTIDPLTQLFNRREIIKRLECELIRYTINKTPFSIIIADIDFFKKVNDTYGHNCGDYILKSVADILKNSVRKQDSVSRWGGEEFLIVLPDTDTNGAVTLAEKLRTNIENSIFDYGEFKVKVTMTFGVNIYNKMQELDSFISKADSALYEGKQKSRNCVIMYNENNWSSCSNNKIFTNN